MTLNQLHDALIAHGHDLLLLNQTMPMGKGQMKLYSVRPKTCGHTTIVVIDNAEDGCTVYLPNHDDTLRATLEQIIGTVLA